MRFRNNKGFTLIELLIVLAILGILVGIVAMSVGGLVGTARTTGMNSELEVVQTAIDTYNTQDVAVDPANHAVITACDDPTVITAVTDEQNFAKYLKRDTRYYYTWSEGGLNLAVTDIPE